jgi:hypothetical protein
MIRKYEYHFELGKTANGTQLGWGDVCINYYADMAFARMQTWESVMWDGVLAIAHESGEYDYPMQTWTDTDMACRHPLDADMEQYRHDTGNADMKSRMSSPSPSNQQSSDRRKLSKSRGTQAQPTLELRARLIEFLAGGGGEILSKISDNKPRQPLAKRATEYIQGELFSEELLRKY